MQLRGLETDLEHDVHDTLRRVVAEHAHGEHVGRQTPDDVVGLHRLDLTRRRREHEADGIGTESRGQQRIFLVRDATDLYEHGGDAIGLRRAGRRRPPPDRLR